MRWLMLVDVYTQVCGWCSIATGSIHLVIAGCSSSIHFITGLWSVLLLSLWCVC